MGFALGRDDLKVAIRITIDIFRALPILRDLAQKMPENSDFCIFTIYVKLEDRKKFPVALNTILKRL